MSPAWMHSIGSNPVSASRPIALRGTDFTRYWVYGAGPLLGAVLAVGAALKAPGTPRKMPARRIGVNSGARRANPEPSCFELWRVLLLPVTGLDDR